MRSKQKLNALFCAWYAANSLSLNQPSGKRPSGHCACLKRGQLQSKRTKARMIFIFRMKSDRESLAYRSCWTCEFQTRDVSKVTSPAFMATLLFDLSISALQLIVKQNSTGVVSFTHCQGTWAGFRPSWDRLVLLYWWSVVATVILIIFLSTRGTADSDIWFMCLADKPMVRSYHLTDYD